MPPYAIFLIIAIISLTVWLIYSIHKDRKDK